LSDFAHAPHLRRQPILLGAACIALGAMALWFVAQKLHFLTDYSEASYSPYFWPRRLGMLAHLMGGMVATGTGVIQIWLGLTNRVGRLHRLLGRFYVGAISLACPAGAYLALTIPQNLAYASGLFFLAVAWAATTGMAVLAIRLGHVEQHRNWMLRSYTVTFAFVLFRLADPVLHGLFRAPNLPGPDDIDAISAWACWALPLLSADIAITTAAIRRR
jgi:uncharacterized membrane protein